MLALNWRQGVVFLMSFLSATIFCNHVTVINFLPYQFSYIILKPSYSSRRDGSTYANSDFLAKSNFWPVLANFVRIIVSIVEIICQAICFESSTEQTVPRCFWFRTIILFWVMDKTVKCPWTTFKKSLAASAPEPRKMNLCDIVLR